MQGRKTGGRCAGTPNKRTREVIDLLRELDCDPIRGMVEVARDPRATLELRGKVYRDLATYVYPRRKAVEVTTVEQMPTKALLPSWLLEAIRSDTTFGGATGK